MNTRSLLDTSLTSSLVVSSRCVQVYGCRKADTGKMYAMKCLDKKRIKMKQGEPLALNERIMLSIVSTGVRNNTGDGVCVVVLVADHSEEELACRVLLAWLSGEKRTAFLSCLPRQVRRSSLQVDSPLAPIAAPTYGSPGGDWGRPRRPREREGGGGGGGGGATRRENARVD